MPDWKVHLNAILLQSNEIENTQGDMYVFQINFAV